MLIPERFSNMPYVSADQRTGPDVEVLLRRRLERWLQAPGRALPAVERVFVVTGWPGCGKSRFLRQVAEWSEAQRGSWFRLGRRPLRNVVVYLDLEARFEARTSEAFIRQMQDTIAEKRSRKSDALSLCVDHVPPTADDEDLDVVERHLLLPLLRERVFFVFAQQDPRRWALGGKMAHPSPWPLESFSREGLEQMLAHYPEERVGEALQHAVGHPLLALWICEAGVEEGMRRFLAYWIERRGMEGNQEDILRYAYPLAGTSPENEGQGREILEVVDIPGDEWHRASLLLQKVGWWEPFRRREDGRYEAHQVWVPPVRHCLQHLCEHNPQYRLLIRR